MSNRPVKIFGHFWDLFFIYQKYYLKLVPMFSFHIFGIRCRFHSRMQCYCYPRRHYRYLEGLYLVNQGCIFFRGGKNMNYWLAGENIWFTKKNANIRGKRGKNCTWRKNIIFEKGGGDKNILFWANIHPGLAVNTLYIYLISSGYIYLIDWLIYGFDVLPLAAADFNAEN